MSDNASPNAKGSAAVRLAKSSSSSKPATALPALNQAIPATSAANARKAFKNFTLSKFANKVTPSNYVTAGLGAAEIQHRVITEHINSLNRSGSPVRAMKIALPPDSMKKLFPSFNEKAGTIDLGEVLSFIEKSLGGTEFYAQGNPTLNRLAIQSQVQNIIASVKQEAQK